jgi:hypothetical protein
MRFLFFFNDNDAGMKFQASDRFIMKVLANLECRVFQKGETIV